MAVLKYKDSNNNWQPVTGALSPDVQATIGGMENRIQVLENTITNLPSSSAGVGGSGKNLIDNWLFSSNNVIKDNKSSNSFLSPTILIQGEILKLVYTDSAPQGEWQTASNEEKAAIITKFVINREPLDGGRASEGNDYYFFKYNGTFAVGLNQVAVDCTETIYQANTNFKAGTLAYKTAEEFNVSGFGGAWNEPASEAFTYMNDIFVTNKKPLEIIHYDKTFYYFTHNNLYFATQLQYVDKIESSDISFSRWEKSLGMNCNQTTNGVLLESTYSGVAQYPGGDYLWQTIDLTANDLRGVPLVLSILGKSSSGNSQKVTVAINSKSNINIGSNTFWLKPTGVSHSDPFIIPSEIDDTSKLELQIWVSYGEQYEIQAVKLERWLGQQSLADVSADGNYYVCDIFDRNEEIQKWKKYYNRLELNAFMSPINTGQSMWGILMQFPEMRKNPRVSIDPPSQDGVNYVYNQSSDSLFIYWDGSSSPSSGYCQINSVTLDARD